MPDRPQSTDALLTRKQVAEQLNVSVSATYQLQGLPAPVRLTRQIVRWQPDDIDHYIASRKVQR